MLSTPRLRFGEGLEARRTPAILGVGAFVTYFTVVIMRPGIPGKFAIVDVFILALCGYSLVSMMYRGSTATSGAVRMLPWIWVILLGSFLGLTAVGIPSWAMSNLARTMFALLTFVCFWHLLIVARLQRAAIYGTAAGVTLTTVLLVAQSARYRGAALFIHPNYAGHYMAMACMMLIVVAKRWYLKALAVVALLIALQQTSSFGAIAMVIAMLAVYAVRILARNTAILAATLAMIAIGGLLLTTPQAQDLVSNEDSDVTITQSLNTDRFERSGDTRLILWSQALAAWAEEPLGIGPDGVRSRAVAVWQGNILEIHSDALGYLVERGPIGLLGFIGLWVTLILLGKRGGFARVLIAGMLVQGLFRETMHYRHMWLLLALAFALDYAVPRQEPEADAEDVGVEPAGDALGETVDLAERAELPLSERFFPGVERTGPAR